MLLYYFWPTLVVFLFLSLYYSCAIRFLSFHQHFHHLVFWNITTVIFLWIVIICVFWSFYLHSVNYYVVISLFLVYESLDQRIYAVLGESSSHSFSLCCISLSKSSLGCHALCTVTSLLASWIGFQCHRLLSE